MPLTPEDFEDREFLVTLRGYDRDEVQQFLEEAARDYRAAIKAAQATKPPSDPYERIGSEVTEILKAASEVAATLKAEAEQLKVEAAKDAAEMRDRVKQEIASLKESTSSAARQVKEEAEKYATSVRERAEDDMGALKESTAAAARKVKEEAERYAAEVRARAENVAAEKDRFLKQATEEAETLATEIRDRAEASAKETEAAARARIEELTKTELDLKRRLNDLQSALSHVLGAAGAAASFSNGEPADEVAPPTKAAEPIVKPKVTAAEDQGEAAPTELWNDRLDERR